MSLFWIWLLEIRTQKPSIETRVSLNWLVHLWCWWGRFNIKRTRTRILETMSWLGEPPTHYRQFYLFLFFLWSLFLFFCSKCFSHSVFAFSFQRSLALALLSHITLSVLSNVHRGRASQQWLDNGQSEKRTIKNRLTVSKNVGKFLTCQSGKPDQT